MSAHSRASPADSPLSLLSSRPFQNNVPINAWPFIGGIPTDIEFQRKWKSWWKGSTMREYGMLLINTQPPESVQDEGHQGLRRVRGIAIILFKRQAIDSLARSLFVPRTRARLNACMFARRRHPHVLKEQKSEGVRWRWRSLINDDCAPHTRYCLLPCCPPARVCMRVCWNTLECLRMRNIKWH